MTLLTDHIDMSSHPMVLAGCASGKMMAMSVPCSMAWFRSESSQPPSRHSDRSISCAGCPGSLHIVHGICILPSPLLNPISQHYQEAMLVLISPNNRASCRSPQCPQASATPHCVQNLTRSGLAAHFYRNPRSRQHGRQNRRRATVSAAQIVT